MGDGLTESFLETSPYDREERGNGSDFDALRSSLTRVTDAWRHKANAVKMYQPSRESKEDRAPWRNDLGEALESTYTHVFIVTLLLVDLLATAVDILKTINNKTLDLDTCTGRLESCACALPFEKRESLEFIFWVSITILAVLAVNVVLLLVSFGWSFFKHPGYVLDAVVVGTALGLEIFLDTDTVGLLVILTLWRIVRVAHGIFEVTDEAWEKEIKQFELKLKDAEAAHDRDQVLLRRKDERIAELERSGRGGGGHRDDNYGYGGQQEGNPYQQYN